MPCDLLHFHLENNMSISQIRICMCMSEEHRHTCSLMVPVSASSQCAQARVPIGTDSVTEGAQLCSLMAGTMLWPQSFSNPILKAGHNTEPVPHPRLWVSLPDYWTMHISLVKSQEKLWIRVRQAWLHSQRHVSVPAPQGHLQMHLEALGVWGRIRPH